MAELTAYEKAKLRIKEAEAKAKEKGATTLEALRRESTFGEDVNFGALSAYDKARYKLSIAERDAKDMGVGVADALKARKETTSADEAITEALLGTLGKGSGIGLSVTQDKVAQSMSDVDVLKNKVSQMSATPEQKKKKEAEAQFAQAMERARLKPLYDYLYSEGEVENGIPRGEELRKLVDETSGSTNKGIFYGTGANMADYYKAQYMLDPEYKSDHDTYTDGYIKPTEAIFKPSSDGYYHIGSMRYSHDDMVGAIRGYIPYAQQARLWKENAFYQNDVARAMGYASYKDMKIARLNEIRDILTEKYDKGATEAYDEMVYVQSTTPMTHEGVEVGAYLGKLAEGTWQAMKSRETVDAVIAQLNGKDEEIGGYELAGTILASLISPAFGTWTAGRIITSDAGSAGLDEGFDTLDALFYDAPSLLSDANTLIVLNKVKNKGEASLTQSEREIYEIAQLAQEVEGIAQDMGMPKFGMRDLGKGLGYTTEIAVQMAMSMIGTSGMGVISTLPKEGAKVAIKESIKQMGKISFKKSVKQGLKEIGKETAGLSLKLGKNALTHSKDIAKNVGIYAGRSAVGAATSPMTYNEYVKRRIGHYTFTEDGLVNKDVSWVKDLGIAYTETFYEYFSEWLGGAMADFVDITPSKMGRLISMAKSGEDVPLWKAFDLSPSQKAMMRNLGHSGGFSEPASEVLGDLLTSITLAPFSDEHGFDHFKEKGYWMNVISTTMAYGGALSIFGHVGTAKNVIDTKRYSKARDIAEKQIADAALLARVKSALAMDSADAISTELQKIQLPQDKPTEAAAVVEYITNDILIKQTLGEMLEDTRMSRLARCVQKAHAWTYQGVEGNEDTGHMVLIQTKGGRMLWLLAGDITDKSDSSMLKCMTKNGDSEVVVLASEVDGVLGNVSVKDYLVDMYNGLFSTEKVIESLTEIQSAFNALSNPTRDEVKTFYEKRGIRVFNEGDAVTLVDGSQGTIDGVLDNGDYLVSITTPTGEVSVMQVPVLQVLQPDAVVAEAQKVMFKQNVEKAVEDIANVVEKEQTATATPMATEQAATEQTEEENTLEEDEKALMSTFPVTEDGSPDFDSISTPKQYALLFAREMGSKEVAHAQMQQMKANAVEEAEKLREKGKKLSKANDVVKNNKAIAELEARANFYDGVLKHLAPPVEQNIAENVEEAEETMQEAEETIASEYKAGDIVEHDGKKARVMSVEDNGALVIDYKMGAGDVANMVVVNAAEVRPATEDVAEHESQQQRPEVTEGLVENEFTAVLNATMKRVIDTLAKMLKVKVIFVATLNGANGQISGDTVYLSWEKRSEGVNFLAGHELLHRMRDLAPEAYAKFKKAVEKYLGTKKWKRKVDEMRRKYEATNASRARKRGANANALAEVEKQIAQNGSVEAAKAHFAEMMKSEDKAAVATAINSSIAIEDAEIALQAEGAHITLQTLRDKIADTLSNIPAQLTITDELMMEEVVADQAGIMAEKHFALEGFVNHINDNKVLKVLRDWWARLMSLFANLGLRTEAIKVKRLVNALDKFIIIAAKAEGKVAKTGEVKHPTATEGETRNSLQNDDNVGTYSEKMHAVNVTDSMRESVMQGQPKFSLPSLVGVHNLSLDKLRKVIKMGGLANPSVAVIDVDKQTHVDYGEYSLILPKNMVDARQGKNAGTWAGDAWTPTYPQVVKRMNDNKAISRFYKDIDALPEAMRSRVRLDFDSFMDGRSANALAYWYLFEKGNAPEMVLVPSRYSNDVTNAVLEATKGSFSMFNLTPEERAKCLDAYIAVKFDGDRTAFEAEMQARIERLAKAIETKKSDRVKKWAQDTIDSIKEYGFDYDDVANFIRDVGYDAREKGKVNVDATILAAQERINESNLAAEYDAWRNNLDERYGIDEFIFDGYTNSGNRRYLPHTVENASKWMKKQGRQGAVATFPSFGTFVAVSIPKMTTLESIRKRKALLGKSKEEYDAFREKWENVYYELGKKLQPDAKSFEDYGYWRLIEAVGQKNPKEFIKKEYGVELSEEDMTKFNDMVNAIRTEYPARYFETKFERPLQLSDFTAAVVPNDIPLDVESRLKDANVEVIEYEKGDNASRAEAMQKASEMKNVRFSLVTPEMDASYLDAVERGDMATAQKMVMEAAKLAMPNTKVVDEDGNPKVVYHGTPNNFNAFSKEMFGTSTDRGIWGNGFYFSDSEQYAKTYEKRGDKQGRTLTVFLNIENPLFISLRNGGNEGAMYFHELMEKHFTDDIYEDATRTDELMSVAQERLTADIVAKGYDGIVVEYTNHIDTEYVAFEPNQIKSADPVTYDDAGNVIPLSERFNPEKEDTRYSLIGEQGASTLDAYEEATTRLDNLNVAREMEAQGKDALAIKQATGWERGKDGLWRYEVTDYVNMFDFTGNVDFMRRHPEYRRYKELLRKRNVGMMFFKKGLTKEEQKEFDDLAIVYGNGVQLHNSHKLKDYLDSEELFAAYPQLRDINVEIKKELEDGYYGRYIPSRNTIELATRTYEYMARTLFHEVQHAIQHIEGFANGGNTEIADPRKVRERKEAMEGLQRKIDMHERTLERFEAELSELNDSMEKWWKSHPEAMSREDFDSEMQALSEVYDEQLKKAEREQNKLRETQKEYKKLVESSATLGYEGYERLAGEVEARATARRVGMSEEERRNTLQLNDEDVARKDQIILRNGLFENYADAQEATRYSISEPSSTDRMVDISDVMTVAEHKAAMLENAKRMASEGMDAQKIVDETGWIELEDGWHYYGDADIVLSDAKANKLRIQRWLESKRAVKRAQVRKLYAPLIKEQEALISDLEKGRAVKGRTSANYANAVEAILDGRAVEGLPIEDQILVDIALGQKLRWADEKDGSRRGLATELGLHNAKDEGMEAVTRGAKDYVEDYVAALVERNNGYENGINDNDVRNAVIEAFRSYPSRQAALDELSARYPNAATTEAREGIARLEFERDEALAEIDAEHRATMEDFEVNTERYMREYEDAQAWNESIDVYTQSLAKARNEIKRLERESAEAHTSAREKQEAMKAIKAQISNMLRGDVSRYLRKRDMQALMNAVNEAQTTFAMARAIEKAMWTIFDVRMRKEYARMNNLLKMRIVLNETNIDVEHYLANAVKEGKVTTKDARNLLENYWKGVNAGGLVVARFIDGDTAEVVNFVHDHSDYAKLKAQGVDINKYCDELENMLRGNPIEGTYFNKHMQKKYGALSEAVRERMVEALDIVRGYLDAQALMDNVKQSSESAQISDEILKLKGEIDALNAEIEEMRKEGKVVKDGEALKDKEVAIKERKAKIAELNKDVVKARMSDIELYMGSMPYIVERMNALNTAVERLIKEGRVRFTERRVELENHRRNLINMVLEDIDRPAAQGRTEQGYTAWQKIEGAGPVEWLTSSLGSFEHLLRVATRNAPNGEGAMYEYFVTNIHRANNNIYDAQQQAYEEMSAKTKALFGMSYDRVMRMAERTVLAKYDRRFDKEHKAKGERFAVVGTEWADMTIANALDIISMWNQPNGRATLEKQGFTEEKIEAIKETLNKRNPKWLEFQQWVVNEFLPAKRVKYNNVYREMNGVDMSYEVNYFPMRRDAGEIPMEVDLTSPTFVNAPMSSTTTGAIIKRTGNVLPFDLSVSFFGVLKEHIVEMEEWAGMASVTRDLNMILSNPAVRKALEAVHKGFYKTFADAAKTATNNHSDGTEQFEKAFLNVTFRMWAAARLAGKAFTALKQFVSNILFLPYAKDPKFIGRFLWYYSFGNIPLTDRVYQHIARGAHYEIKSNAESHVNITWAYENSAMFRKRWESGAAGNNIFTRDMVYGKGETKLGRMINDIMKGLDMTANFLMRGIALIDALTVAAGMRAIYEQELILLQKGGMSREEAHEIAMLRAEIAANKTQQSAENLYLAPVQKNRGAIATMLTMFQNATFAQGRNITEATRELTRDRDAERAWLVNEEMKRLRKVNARFYERIEDIIKKEKEQGIITNQKEEDMRREQLRKDEDYALMPEAEKRAKKKMHKAKTRALFTLFMNAWIGPAVFNAMQYLPYLLMGDDDEEKKKMLKMIGWQTALGPIGALPLGNALISGLMGYGFDYASPITDTTNDLEQIWKVAQEEGFNVDVAMLCGEWLLERLAGIDLQTFEQIYSGVESMIEDGYSREAVLNILGSPKSQVRLLAYERKEGETYEEYVTRIMRLYTIFDTPTYYDYHDENGKYIGGAPFGMKEYMLKDMSKEYEKAYRRDVLSEEVYDNYLSTEELYDTNHTAMGWRQGSNPSKKAYEKAWVQDATGEWRFEPPVMMSVEEYSALYELALDAIWAEREARTFVGQDEDEYRELVAKEVESKHAFNKKFSEITNK